MYFIKRITKTLTTNILDVIKSTPFKNVFFNSDKKFLDQRIIKKADYYRL